jgi:hypothetical protein
MSRFRIAVNTARYYSFSLNTSKLTYVGVKLLSGQAGCLLSCLSSVTYEYIYIELQEFMCLLLNNLLAHSRTWIVLLQGKDMYGRSTLCVFIHEVMAVLVNCSPFCLLIAPFFKLSHIRIPSASLKPAYRTSTTSTLF